MLPPKPNPPPPRPPKPPPPPLPHSAQHHGLWRVSAPRLCGRTPLVFESAREHPLQGCDEAGVHFDQLLFAPRAELGISRVDAVIVDEEIIGDGESHGGQGGEAGPTNQSGPSDYSSSIFIFTRIGKLGGPMFLAMIFPAFVRLMRC